MRSSTWTCGVSFPKKRYPTLEDSEYQCSISLERKREKVMQLCVQENEALVNRQKGEFMSRKVCKSILSKSVVKTETPYT